jgi:hypothetical protein
MGTADAAVSICDVTTAPGRVTSVMGAVDEAISACDIMTTPDRTTSAPGAPDVPSICSPADTATGGTFPLGVVATLAPLLLASSVAPNDS